MVIKNFFVICALSILVSLMSSCVHVKKQVKTNLPDVNVLENSPIVLPEVEPEVPEQATEEEKVLVSEVLQQKDKKVYRPKLGLILGPGLAKSFVHIGVLKRFQENKIPIHYIGGLGWGSLPAYEFSNQKSIHGLEWKVSRSEAFSQLLKTSFWNKEFQARQQDELAGIVKNLVTGGKSSKIPFRCSLMQGISKKVKAVSKSMLIPCMSVAPLFEGDDDEMPYLSSIKALTHVMKNKGVEKIIFINVTPKGSVQWGKLENSVKKSDRWMWNFVEEELSKEEADHTFEIPTGSFSMLDFDKSLDMVRKGYDSSFELIKFLRKEYQF